MSTVRWIQEQRGSLAGSRALCIFISSSFSTWVQPHAGIPVSSTHPVTGPLSAQTHSCSCVTHQSQEKLLQPSVCLSVPEGTGINQLMAFPAFNARPLKCSGGTEPQQFVLLGFYLYWQLIMDRDRRGLWCVKTVNSLNILSTDLRRYFFSAWTENTMINNHRNIFNMESFPPASHFCVCGVESWSRFWSCRGLGVHAEACWSLCSTSFSFTSCFILKVSSSGGFLCLIRVWWTSPVSSVWVGLSVARSLFLWAEEVMKPSKRPFNQMGIGDSGPSF